MIGAGWSYLQCLGMYLCMIGRGKGTCIGIHTGIDHTDGSLEIHRDHLSIIGSAVTPPADQKLCPMTFE
jgi:hypothetical protein